ncbi:SDR family NAD(P)-dependent oxidoreductase [Evansella halocellulosilytica]|uniref:SDR family NAD(P)-dependent oxidoreductase n=1 Tax=Evansella halocellulosilytica TaxID=2011013 RepID=UPI000BB8F340|nr:SDR family oxidoreductase [Evansella halocellulosilytica]
MKVNEWFHLNGKTAIVTGGAGHIGTALSEALAEAGANVYIVSRNEEKCQSLANKLTRHSKGKIIGKGVDISDEQSIQSCIREIISDNQSIDILVNNAHFGSAGEVTTLTDEEWNYSIEGTINSVFRCTKAVLPNMVEQQNGTVINISSMYGVVSPDPRIYGDSGLNNPPNYGAGKAAIIQFTKYIACHYGNQGIRANSISPGAFPNHEVQENQEFIQRLQEKNPLGRIGTPEDLKGVTVFLASRASDYVTGQNVCVDGGWTAW